MTVAQILNEKGGDVVSVGVGATVMDALIVLKEHRIGAVLVMDDDGSVAGVLSERDVVRALPDEGGSLLLQPVSSLMTRGVISCETSHSMTDVMALMTQRRIRHLPVIEGGRLLGMISIGDVVKHRIAETEHEAEALKSYIALG